MPILGALMLTLFTGLVDFFVKFFTREVAIRLALAALIVAAFATLYTALQVLVASVAISMPGGLVTAIEFMMPANITACASVVLATDAAVAGFRLYVAGVRI
jgi:hypothetical protein